MEFIKIQQDANPIYVEILVSFPGAWKYIYIVSLFPQVEYRYSSNQPSVKQAYSIGRGQDVVNSANNWDFQLINQSGTELKYEIKISWFQGNNPKPIHVWEKSGEFKDGEAPKRFPDNCQYI